MMEIIFGDQKKENSKIRLSFPVSQKSSFVVGTTLCFLKGVNVCIEVNKIYFNALSMQVNDFSF